MKRLLLVIIAATAIIIPADKKGAVKHKRVAKKKHIKNSFTRCEENEGWFRS
ncbi:MAG: hypothetical protein JWQ40_3741 [Segetibacter sp.]|nr:hypothetical protein [Segetibacter sp.]